MTSTLEHDLVIIDNDRYLLAYLLAREKFQADVKRDNGGCMASNTVTV